MRPSLTEDFLERSSYAEPDALATGNTNMTGVEVCSEREVMRELSDIVQHTTGLVLADFASADVDRLRSFYQTAVNNCRRLVVTLKQAYLLHRLGEDLRLDIPRIDDENIRIYEKPEKRYYWEQEIMRLGETVDSRNITEEQSDVIMVSSFYELGELAEIKPSLMKQLHTLSVRALQRRDGDRLRKAHKLAETLRSAAISRTCLRAHHAATP